MDSNLILFKSLSSNLFLRDKNFYVFQLITQLF